MKHKGIYLCFSGMTSVWYGFVYVSEKMRDQFHIPTKAIEKEKNQAYLYIRNPMDQKRYGNPNKGSLSSKARQLIKEVLPSPIAKFILLLDKNHIDLAEDYLSPWSVLQDAYSRNKDIRLHTVEKIASYKYWNGVEVHIKTDFYLCEIESYPSHDRIEWKDDFQFDDGEINKIDLDAEFRTLAQVLDFKTLVSLGRTYDVDMRLFLPPHPLPPIKSILHLEDLLRSLLSKLPHKDVDQCIQYFTTGALNMSDEQRMKRGGLWCFGGNGLNYTRDILPQENIESFCLQALVKHSNFQNHCEIMVKFNALQLLQQIRSVRPNNLEIQRNIIRIIANICRFDMLHPAIGCSGWLSILTETSKSTDCQLRMQASRALVNLDRETTSEIFEDGTYLVYPRYRSKLKPEADVIFIHGLMGGAFYSWRQQDGASGTDDKTDCWPEDWVPQDLPGVRVLCVEYDTELSEWMAMCPHETETRTISFRSRTLLDKIKHAGVGDRPIVWVSHSMGGLIVKHMLMDAMENPKKYGKILSKTKGVVFFSTPHFGSQLANYSRKIRRILFPSVEVMELSRNSPKLGVMNDTLQRLVEKMKIKVLSFGEMQTTNIGHGLNIKILIVPPESAENPKNGDLLDEKLMEMAHKTIIKSNECVCTPLVKNVERLGMLTIPNAIRLQLKLGDAVVERNFNRLAATNESAQVHLKLENMQISGSFKSRGVAVQMEHISALVEDGGQRLVTMSAGNYGKAFAIACQHRGIKGTVVMPHSAPKSRQTFIQSSGCEVIRVPSAVLMTKVEELIENENMLFLPPFDDINIIAGYSSIGLEILDEVIPDIVLVCCGGGGLVSGISAALKLRGCKKCRIYAVEPETANTMERSLHINQPASLSTARSIASGLAPPFTGKFCFKHVKEFATGVITVKDEEIIASTRMLYQRGLLVEPSGAAAFGALVFNKVPDPRGIIVVVLTGGNVAPQELINVFGKYGI